MVNRLNADLPLEFYRFFKEIGCHYIQFTPIVEQDMHELSVTPEQWRDFCCAVFDEWYKSGDVGKHCGHAGVMEWTGDVYSCDHFVLPLYKLGNIHEKLSSK